MKIKIRVFIPILLFAILSGCWHREAVDTPSFARALQPFRDVLGDPSWYGKGKDFYAVRWHQYGIAVLIKGDERDGYYITGLFEWKDRMDETRWMSEVIRILRKQVKQQYDRE